MRREFRTFFTFCWNAAKHPPGKGKTPEKKPPSPDTKCKEEPCADLKCIPPKFISCSTSGQNICVYEPSSTVTKPCLPDKPDPEWRMIETQKDRGPRVIILGAGFSGLTAADRLIKGGHNNLVILEADCRAGGRLKSSWAGDTVVELGLKLQEKATPTWNNPLMKLGLAQGIFPPPTEGDPSSGLLDEPLPLPLVFKMYTFLKKLVRDEKCYGNPRGYISLRFQQAGGHLPHKYKNQTARILAAATSLMGPKLQVEENSFGAFAIAPGGLKVPLGESGHIMPLLESVGPGRILYKKEAVSIRWGTVTLSQKPRVIVRCRDGSEYPGEFVIISCSLGTLKNSLDTMFFPPLPTKKATAIQKIGFEHQNMAYLVFDEPIWTWSPRPVELNLIDKEDPKDWSSCIKVVKQVEGSQHVIGFQVVSSGAVKVERIPKDEVLKVLHSVLKERLSDDNIPEPKDVVRSRWSGVRYFAGSHSCAGTAQERAELAAPLPSPDQLPPILLFAGEATCPQPGLRAAVLSGLREAERLLSIFPNLNEDKGAYICPEVCPK